MLHIYRQITSLKRVRPVVLAQKRENEERFPFQDIRVVKKPAWHFLRRIWFKQIIDRPWQIIADEVCDIERALTESNAQLLHIYFGHVAVLLRPLIRHCPKRERLQSLARDLKIASAVYFPGFVSQEELRQLLYSSHLFLHPSETGRDGNQEGVPNSMLEAMATGLPVFATRHGGIPEAVGHKISAMLVEERDYE